MNREEIAICKIYLDDLDKTHDCNEYKLLMDLLDKEPSEDCVGKAEVKKIAKEMYLEVANMDIDATTISDCISCTASKCREVLERQLQALQPATPTRRVGKWIRKPIRNNKGGCVRAEMICTYCGKDNECDKKLNYCPNCGAYMQEVNEC